MLNASTDALTEGFLATTSERIARLRTVAFRTGVSARQIPVNAGPAECGTQQKLSTLMISNPDCSNGVVYSSSDGRYASSGDSTVPFSWLRNSGNRSFMSIITHTPPGRRSRRMSAAHSCALLQPVTVAKGVDAEDEVEGSEQVSRQRVPLAAARSRLRSLVARDMKAHLIRSRLEETRCAFPSRRVDQRCGKVGSVRLLARQSPGSPAARAGQSGSSPRHTRTPGVRSGALRRPDGTSRWLS